MSDFPPENTVPEDVYFTFCGAIDHLACQRIFENFAIAINTGAKRAHVLFQSAGGIVGDGLALYSYFKGIPLDVIMYNGGSVRSIAVLPFLAAKKRYAAASCTFLVHKTAYPSQLGSAIQLRLASDAAVLDDENVERVLHAHLSMPDEKWQQHMWADLIFGADDAKQYGMIDGIADWSPPEGAKVYNILA